MLTTSTAPFYGAAYGMYDVMGAARLNFIENRVVPLCRRLEAEEDAAVKCLDPEAQGWFDVEDHPVLTEARRSRLAAARAGFDMGIPLNDLNRAFDLGFRPFPWGDQGFVPSTMQRVEAGGTRDEGRGAKEGRNPNTETRKKAEIRKPKAAADAWMCLRGWRERSVEREVTDEGNGS